MTFKGSQTKRTEEAVFASLRSELMAPNAHISLCCHGQWLFIFFRYILAIRLWGVRIHNLQIERESCLAITKTLRLPINLNHTTNLA